MELLNCNNKRVSLYEGMEVGSVVRASEQNWLLGKRELAA